jgi:hypothetical protein
MSKNHNKSETIRNQKALVHENCPEAIQNQKAKLGAESDPNHEEIMPVRAPESYIKGVSRNHTKLENVDAQTCPGP